MRRIKSVKTVSSGPSKRTNSNPNCSSDEQDFTQPLRIRRSAHSADSILQKADQPYRRLLLIQQRRKLPKQTRRKKETTANEK